ncbi:hypothetical protein [Algicola sagamiensis]|uniref:hypothetical protein n=1 Tax=Algicola sagamiensis TaxID=163869 RepID=UPI0012FB7F25|nr:hypothetical protein [Algicola sagamiensis]
MIDKNYIGKLRLDYEVSRMENELNRDALSQQTKVVQEMRRFQSRYRKSLFVLTMVFIISSQFTWEHFKLMAVIYAGVVLFLEAELKLYDIARMSIQVWWEARKCR